MRILFINVSCTGSTGRICADLARTLEARGHEVKIAYGRDDAPADCQRFAHRIGSTAGVYGHVLRARLLDDSGFGSRRQTEEFIRWVKTFDPDIIHLHNLCGYYIHLGVLFHYLRRCGKRIFWTHHDCWAFTGHSVYCDSAGCTRWQSGCHHCPMQREFPASMLDGSARNWQRKKALFADIPNLQLIAPSQWLAEQLKQSFLGQYPVQVIHNGIDAARFQPLPSDLGTFFGAAGKHPVLVFGGEQPDIVRAAAWKQTHIFWVRESAETVPGNVTCAPFHGRELEELCRQADAILDLDGTGEKYRPLFRKEAASFFRCPDDAQMQAALSELPVPASAAEGYWSRKAAAGLLGKEVLLGVTAVWNDQKGLSDFVKLAKMLSENQQIVLIGLTQRQIAALPGNILGLQRTANVQELAAYYSISDYFLNLTYQDTYPTTNLEAICCGTPVISYRTGGSPESARRFGTCVPRGDVAAAAELLRQHPSFTKEEWDCGNQAFLEQQIQLYAL